MTTRRWLAGLALLLAGGLVAALAARHAPAGDPAQPYARWRNGIIVHVRNCEAPGDEESLLRCAALNCARRVTGLLTNAQQARLRLTAYTRSADGSRIEVRGTLDQDLRAPTLPTAFTCSMTDYRRAEPVFVFGRRDALRARAGRD